MPRRERFGGSRAAWTAPRATSAAPGTAPQAPLAVRWVALLAIGVALLAARPTAVAGQGYRGEVRVLGSFLELRPLVRDSVTEGEVEGAGLRRRLDDGTVVTCVPGEFCRWYASGPVESVSVLTQELRVAAWSGVRGLSAHTRLRGRLGSDAFWPRSDQEIEALSAYLNYDAGEYRLRAGRQHRTDGLGYYNFDGVSALWRGLAPLRVEAFAGWSLDRGLHAPRSGDLLEAADEFAPDDRGFLLGAELGGRWGGRVSGSLAYQREIRTDRLALYTERASLDVRALLGRVVVDASSELDLAYGEFNEARLAISAPVAPHLQLSVEGRHHDPFFELWTIWGAFSPVGFTEGRGSVSWSLPDLDLRLEAGGAYRVYEETDAGADFTPVKARGWRAFGNADWTRDGWFAGGGYRAEIGFGAARLGGDVSLGRTFRRGTYLALRGQSTQTISEFRLGEQVLTGAAVEGGVELLGFGLSGGAGLYRLSFDDRPRTSDWTQYRAYFGATYRFGTEIGGDRRPGRMR